MDKQLKAHVALFAASIIYGANYTIAKVVMPRLIHPQGFILLRVLFAAPLFWLVSLQIRKKIDRKDWRILILASFFGVAINQLLFFQGLAITSPIHAALLQLTAPLMITIFSAILISEKITGRKITGLILGIFGAAFLIIMGRHVISNNNTALGDLYVFLNAISYAGYMVIVKPLMSKYHPLQVLRWTFTLGLLWVFPFGWKQFKEIPWHLFAPGDWAAAIFVVTCTTFLGYLLNAFGLRQLTASTTGAYIYLQPLFAAIIAILFFGENLTIIKIIAALFIFSGVYLVSGRKKRSSTIDQLEC